jgi:flagellar biosynthesis regulator FlaF
MTQMKNIELKKLTLSYFKGQKSLSVNFKHITSIKGANGTGKSTVLDAWTWLLFGKNAQGQSDTSFSIKTLDANNNVIQKVEHTVEGLILVQGQEILLKRTLREKWVKKKGAINAEYTGNETIYFYNDVPKSQREYSEKISAILNEDIFKVCSDTLAFNALHWNKMREILMDTVGGEVADSAVALGNERFESLLNKLSNKDLDEYKRELAAKRAKLMKEISFIPSRIDEQTKSKPEEIDFKEVEDNIFIINESISKVDLLIEDRNKILEKSNKSRTENLNTIFDLKSKNQNIEFELKTKINSTSLGVINYVPQKEAELCAAKNLHESYLLKLNHASDTLEVCKNEIINSDLVLVKIRQEWADENAKVLKFDEGSFDCPACKRILEVDDIESEKFKMINDFNTDKRNALNSIKEKGLVISERVNKTKERIIDFELKLDSGKSQILASQTKLDLIQSELEVLKTKTIEVVDKVALLELEKSKSNQYQSNLKEIETLEFNALKESAVDVSDLKVKRDQLNKELRELNYTLYGKEQILKIETRISELEKEESNFANEIASIEKEQFTAYEFTIAKVEALEVKINKLFTDNISVKMFKEQTDGVIPWCTILVNGVPFSDANTAGKTNAGLSIINVLNNYYNIAVPVFIDNRESTTNLINTDSQVVNLIVDPDCKKLQVT